MKKKITHILTVSSHFVMVLVTELLGYEIVNQCQELTVPCVCVNTSGSALRSC